MEQYNVTGMTCAACSGHVEKAVRSVEGVTEVSVSLLTNSMGVSGTADPSDIIRAVEKAGYGASLKGNTQTASSSGPDADSLVNREIPVLRNRLIISIIFLIPLMYVSMGHMLWNWPLPPFLSDHISMGLYQLILTAIIMVVNQKFFVSGYSSLIRRAPNMDTLVALGSTAAFVYSTVALFAMANAMGGGDMDAGMRYMDEFYFESAATILTLITVGKLLEALSKGRTTDALKSLMKLAPQTACLLVDGQETTVPINQVKAGDLFVVRPGDSIPVDGVVVEGTSAINESALTGESIPVDKTAGDNVSAATINQSGFLTCQATRVGEDTTLSQIIQMVSDAAATKAPIAKVADTVSGFFVPTVIVLALITIAVWLISGQSAGFALARGISVLVISCPCALGLATPVAIMVGSGMGAKHGTLFKNAASLEASGKIDIIALDKTGTITQGKPQVTDIIPASGINEQELLTDALALEQRSEHPLALAILACAKERNLSADPASDFQAHPGNGLSGLIDGQKYYGGNADFIKSYVSIPEDSQKAAEALAAQGKTPLYFARQGQLLGIIAVADVVKETSPQAIRELQNMGIQVVMLTGDNQRTAQAIGAQVGVDAVISDVLPADKEAVIRRLKEYGKTAMVGDGINDAPALTRADTGIAIGAGADVAVDAADVVLMKNDLLDVPAAVRLSRATLRNIHQNLFWAFFYNVIGIPLAAGVWYPIFGLTLNPMFGAAAMSLSSFCVVMNALRLNLFDMSRADRDKKRNKVDININDIIIKKESEKKVEVNNMTKTLKVEGMTCPHCEKHVVKALEAIDGVASATADHTTNTVVVNLDKDVAEAEFKAAVEGADYTYAGIQ